MDDEGEGGAREIKGSGFELRVHGSGFGSALDIRVQSLVLRVQDSAYRVQGVGCRV